jgi:hypothetical protein
MWGGKCQKIPLLQLRPTAIFIAPASFGSVHNHGVSVAGFAAGRQQSTTTRLGRLGVGEPIKTISDVWLWRLFARLGSN